MAGWLSGWVVGWGQSQIKDHPSPSKARVGAELGNKNFKCTCQSKPKIDIKGLHKKCSYSFKGIPSHIHKSYLKDKYFCPDHNYTLDNLKNFFIWEKKVKN